MLPFLLASLFIFILIIDGQPDCTCNGITQSCDCAGLQTCDADIDCSISCFSIDGNNKCNNIIFDGTTADEVRLNCNTLNGDNMCRNIQVYCGNNICNNNCGTDPDYSASGMCDNLMIHCGMASECILTCNPGIDGNACNGVTLNCASAAKCRLGCDSNGGNGTSCINIGVIVGSSDFVCNGDQCNSYSLIPTTASPTTIQPTSYPSISPTTTDPTTSNPTTAIPTTSNPTTLMPSTSIPTSAKPTDQPTLKPITAKPISAEPTTNYPTNSPTIAPTENVTIGITYDAGTDGSSTENDFVYLIIAVGVILFGLGGFVLWVKCRKSSKNDKKAKFVAKHAKQNQDKYPKTNKMARDRREYKNDGDELEVYEYGNRNKKKLQNQRHGRNRNDIVEESDDFGAVEMNIFTK